MTRPKVWLPEDVLYGERTREALCGIIRAWSRQWGFNQSVTVVISNDRSDHLSPVSPEASITVQGTSIELSVPSDDALRLFCEYLGHPSELLVSKKDIDLATEFITSSLTALMQNLERSLILESKITGEAEEQVCGIFSIGDAKCYMRIPVNALARFRKHLAGKSEPVPKPAGLKAALGDMEVRLSAFIGHVSLTYKQLSSLKPADIIRLDSVVGPEVGLMIDDQTIGQSAILSSSESGKISLELINEIDD